MKRRMETCAGCGYVGTVGNKDTQVRYDEDSAEFLCNECRPQPTRGSRKVKVVSLAAAAGLTTAATRYRDLRAG